MTAYFDTNSLLALVRYYYPFDTEFWDKWLFESVKNGSIRILPEVLAECQRVSGGVVCETFEWLDKSMVYKIPDEELAETLSEKFFRQVDEHFVRKSVIRQKQLTAAEYEQLVQRWISSADGQLIIAAKTDEDACIVTEESEHANDQKEFKKIPALAKSAFIQKECINLPRYLAHRKVEMHFAIN